MPHARGGYVEKIAVRTTLAHTLREVRGDQREDESDRPTLPVRSVRVPAETAGVTARPPTRGGRPPGLAERGAVRLRDVASLPLVAFRPPSGSSRKSSRIRSPREASLRGREPPAVRQGGATVACAPGGRRGRDRRAHGPALGPGAVGRVLRRARSCASPTAGSTSARQTSRSSRRPSGSSCSRSGPISSSSTATRTRRWRALVRPGAAGVPVAHVEAGLRSGDLTMPEEHNRIEVDATAALLFCPDERSREQLRARGRRRSRRGRGRRDGRCQPAVHPHRSRAHVATSPARYLRRGHHPPRGQREAAAAASASSRVSIDSRSPSSSRLIHAPARHSRIKGLTLASHVELMEPLGYLAFASAASQARVIVTDSGGLQKEAYWYGSPVRHRPSFDGVGRHGRAGRERAGRRRSGRARRRRRRGANPRTSGRCSTATGTRPRSIAALLSEGFA